MSEKLATIKSNLEQGIPDHLMDELVSRKDLEVYTKGAKDALLVAHAALHHAFREGDTRVTAFHGDKGEQNLYITYRDRYSNPTYAPWDTGNPATDIGLRAPNPEYEGVVNPMTIVHADSEAAGDFQKRGAPEEMVDAVDAAAQLNKFIVDEAAIPYLRQVAEAFGIDADEYVEIFFPSDGSRARTLTRVIGYHQDAQPGQRPVSKVDEKELLIKEHNDKSSFTVDIEQSARGLQYLVDGKWQPADTRITSFRGAADDYLGLEKQTPPTFHRAVVGGEGELPKKFQDAGLVRIAIPLFISPSVQDARVVEAGSSETHTANT